MLLAKVVGPFKMMQVLKAQAGGFYGVGCLTIHMYNYKRDMREARKAIDVLHR